MFKGIEVTEFNCLKVTCGKVTKRYNKLRVNSTVVFPTTHLNR